MKNPNPPKQTHFEEHAVSVQEFKEFVELCPHNSGDWLIEIRTFDPHGRQGAFYRFVAPWKKVMKIALAVIDVQPSAWDTRLSCCFVSWNREKDNKLSIRKQLTLFLEKETKIS